MEIKIAILQELSKKDALQTQLSNKLKINPTTCKNCLFEMRKAGLLSKAGWIYSIRQDGRDLVDKLGDMEKLK
ncbi:winged helix-turn-helix domain-containing protein [Candidatus Pacearchaeota archaeon]|jgi:Mn-dependent DtxR family transcriptional regulator|nr:winged helix-turn-helix domain-containing protein [Candidatus Pacearchaeota archaeon]